MNEPQRVDHPYSLKWRYQGVHMVCYLAPTISPDPDSTWIPLLMVRRDVLDIDTDDALFDELMNKVSQWYLRCAKAYGIDPAKWPKNLLSVPKDEVVEL